jgi:uncharacterized OB-fold protein
MTTRFHTELPAAGKLQLQSCGACGKVNYPPRELCGSCLADALDWRTVDDTGTVQTLTELHYSLEPQYAENLPWPVASVKLDCGPVAFAHLQPGTAINSRVTLRVIRDRNGNRMLAAMQEHTGEATDWLTTSGFQEEDS